MTHPAPVATALGGPVAMPPGGAMLCVTAAERNAAALASRLRAHADAALQEVRLDALDRIDDSLLELVGRRDRVVTCRSRDARGAFGGTERERFELLSRVLRRGPGYLDVELSSDPELRRELFARRGKTRIVLSHHEWTAGRAGLRGESLAALARQLACQPADVVKIAVTVDDAAELGSLRDALPHETRPVVRVAMGPAGLLSRALPARFGSAWTYVAADGSAGTAPGQLGFSQARAWRVDERAVLTPIGLVGGEQVLRSPGPTAYNALLAARGAPFIYLPVPTERPVETLALLEALGFAGVSVTMPAKEALLERVHALMASAARAGAINTVRLCHGRRVGLNTDVAAVRLLLSDLGGARALVLGAGGAARAAVVALLEQGCSVAVSSRSAERARSLGAALPVASVPWEERDRTPFDVLVQATPCGADGVADPMPPGVEWAGRTVLDMVLVPRASPLLVRVARGGGRAIAGIEMWLRQGALQLSALTGLRVEAEELRTHLPEPWAGAAAPCAERAIVGATSRGAQP
jgi:3-dehydroquinate dehydratase/shikimate dehydrogenase